jgi:hypothetical protein
MPCTAMSSNSERFQPPRLWKSIGHRDRHVDADHADLDAVREFARRVAVAGEDRDAVAIFLTIDELARRVELGDDVIRRRELNWD